MGKFSRNKGSRVERGVIQYFRDLGYTAYRIPLSGAAQGDKGDIKVEVPHTRTGNRPMDATFIYGEVKARATDFNAIYNFFDTGRGNEDHFAFQYAETYVIVSKHFDDLGIIGSGAATQFSDTLPSVPSSHKTAKKICNLKALLKGCDFLIIKGDHKPFLFMRFYNAS